MITPSLSPTQYRRNYSAVCTAAKTTYNDSTSAVLLYVAGPDGGLMTKLSAIPRATVTATQCQLFLSPDGGTTFQFINSALMAGYTMAQTTAAVPTNFTQSDGTTYSESNGFGIAGATNYGAAGVTPTFVGKNAGTSDALTFPYYLSTLTPATGQMFYFEAATTNATTTPTATMGTATSRTIIRDSGAAIVAGDITAGFRYGMYYDGTNFRLLITQRLYVGIGVALAGGVVFNASIGEY
jgi:hypothetical protein